MTRSVLIDDDDLAHALEETLQAFGYDAAASFSGADAIDRLRVGRSPDVILLDLMMPSMNGRGVCERLSRTPNLDAIPVIIITAASNLKRPMPDHVRAVVPKPLDLESLLERIKNESAGAHPSQIDTR